MTHLKQNCLILGLLVFVGSLLFGSCVLNHQPDRDPGLSVYQSKNYVLYPRNQGVTLGDMARQYYDRERETWRIEDAHDPDSPGSAAFITIPLKEKHKDGLFASGYQAIYILCYHKFAPNDPSPLNTPPGGFRKHLTFLKDNGFRTISPDMLLDFLRFRRQIPKRAVVITIGDGYDMAGTMARGGNPFFSNPLALKRDMILNKDIKTFQTRLHTFTQLSLK